MVINLFFFIYSIIIIFGKGEGGRGLIFGGDIVRRIRGLTFGGGLIFGGLRYGHIWVLFLKNLLSEGVSCKVRYLKIKMLPLRPPPWGGGGSGRYYIILHQKPNTQPSALNYKLIPCPQKIVVARLTNEQINEHVIM